MNTPGTPGLRVALVHRDLHRITRGGICTVYRALAGELAARGHSVTLITQATPHPLPPAVRTPTGGAVTMITLPRDEDLAGHGRRVTATLAELRPDIAECSTWEHELLDHVDHPAPGGHRVPVVVRGDLSAATMSAASLARGEQALLSRADAVLAVSRFAAADLHQAYGVRPLAVPNGVDVHRFHPAGPRALRSGRLVDVDTPGRVTASVPLTELIAHPTPVTASASAWVRAWRGDPALRDGATPRVLWVGKATRMKGWDRLEQLAPRLAGRAELLVVLGHGQVHFPVAVTRHRHVTVVQDLDDADMPALYRGADWLLSTSRWEGFGLAIAEAIASGTPALLPTDLAVAGELLAAGGGRTYRTDTELLAALAAPAPPAPRLPADLTWTANTDTTLQVYRQVLTDRSARG